jgi:hypothetical protein
MAYLNHITLSTGHTRRSPRAEVANDTIKILQLWLKAAIAHGDDDYPLPGPLGDRDGFVAGARVQDGALICSIGQMRSGQVRSGPMVTFGVAARSRQSGELWALMCAQYGSAAALIAPSTPWCAVALHPEFMRQAGGMSEWVGDFERCAAWAWVEQA